MQKIDAFKTWHGDATIQGSKVLMIAQREGVQLPGGNAPSRGWLYRFQQRTGLPWTIKGLKNEYQNKKQAAELDLFYKVAPVQ
ncbi:hypothetical protein PInf_026291 [Phytophthora infestans]|nr:hypothetical protein PInf_026291 [Phytophthora infestans]